ncbi:pannexin-2 [Dryobates pubescens]|uniref:pannexin-2 n=1 Tax=Dryobates pubescens TaxID=118200 RepID=UPI0023B8C8E1|nr:pannexin-2 [Dryobates pubescens]XP_054034841.1 pannexin-2 [Dryobates pubescens]
MQHIIDNHPDMATALLAGEKLKELILPGQQDDKAGALAALLLQLKLELPFDRVVTIGTVLIPILLVTLVFTKNFAGRLHGHGTYIQIWKEYSLRKVKGEEDPGHFFFSV